MLKIKTYPITKKKIETYFKTYAAVIAVYVALSTILTLLTDTFSDTYYIGGLIFVFMTGTICLNSLIVFYLCQEDTRDDKSQDV